MRYACLVLASLLCGAASADPLHDAARKGDVEQARQLIEQGADASAPDEAGEPPLLIAALAGNADMVALLLDNGAAIDTRNKGGLTALHAAAYAGQIGVAELLIERGAKVNENGNFYHMSPLHAAAEEGHADIVALLIANDAEIEAKERNGYTPLTQAGWREHWKAADLLMKAGAVCQPADLVGDWLHGECMKRNAE